MHIVVEIHRQTVVQHIGKQSEVPFRGRLPLNVLIAYRRHLHTNSLIIISHGREIGMRGIVRNVIVTADIKSGIQSQIIHSHVLREPVFAAYQPTSLHAWEHRPACAENIHCARSLFSEPTVCLRKQRYRGEVSVAESIVCTHIALYVLPYVIVTLHMGIAC